MTAEPIYAFATSVHGQLENWGEAIINARNAGEAKAEHWRSVHEAWDGVRYVDIRARKVGGPHTSQEFVRNAKYRGLPDLRCGQRVSVGGASGTIVGVSDGANFSVLFDRDSKYRGNTLAVHPTELKLLPAALAA